MRHACLCVLLLAGAALAEPVTIPAPLINGSTAADARPGWFVREGKPYNLAALGASDAPRIDSRFRLADVDGGRGFIRVASDGPAVKGIAVGRAAEVVLFLHTYDPGPALRDWEQRNIESKARGDRPLEPPVLFRYVIHYDGAPAIALDVRWDEAINDWLRAGSWADPPFAATAWRMTVQRGWVHDRWPREGEHLALYAMRFENPRPDKPIASIDIDPAPATAAASGIKADWGTAAVFAIATASRGYAGRTCYVAPGGDDRGPGSFDRPWATPYKAAEALQAGDTVYFRGGRYKLRQPWQDVIIVKGSGSQSQPITFSAYPGETPVIDGDDHHCAHDQPVPYAIFDRDRGLLNIYEKMNVVVRGLWFENSRKSGIGVYQSRNVLLDHNVVFGTYHCAMNTAANTQFRIIGNTLGKNCSVFFNWDLKTLELGQKT